MKKNFAVINKRGLLAVLVLLLIAIVLFAISISQVASGASKLWFVPLIIFALGVILNLMIIASILTAGVEVRGGMVIFASADGVGGKKPQFEISKLKKIELCNGDGRIENPETDSLVGGRVVFTLKDGSNFTYYPVTITYRQYSNIKSGILKLKECM
jgi:hypothetical protein